MTIPEDSAPTDAASQAERSAASPPPDRPAPAGNRSFWPQVRLLILRVMAVMAAVGVFAMVCTAGAGWYTSRPEFCNSCHIMEPYYESWQESSHSHVSCIKCRCGRKGAWKTTGTCAADYLRDFQPGTAAGRRNPRRELPAVGLSRNAVALRQT
jgi:hypothetical protein